MKKSSASYYTGFSILRIWMCFEVILVHGWAHGDKLNKIYSGFIKYEGIAVPVFMLMSFYLTDMAQLANQNDKVAVRFKRLLIPHLFWTCAYFAIYKLLNIDSSLNWREIVWQVFTGISSLNATMWYQVDLVILTIIIIIIFRCRNTKHAIICIWILGSVALFMEYSGMNRIIFDNFRYELQYSIGRLCEMMPYAVIGIILCYYDILKRFENNKNYIIVTSFLGIYFMTHYSVFITPEGYGYQGIYYIVMAVLLICLFYYCPFHKLPDKFCCIINQVSKYTLGIYCMHRCVITILNIYVIPKINMQVNSFSECILVFIISFIISFIGSQIPIKWVQRAFV